MSLRDTLTKKRDDLEAKGANRTKHEDRELTNLKLKLAAMKKA